MRGERDRGDSERKKEVAARLRPVGCAIKVGGWTSRSEGEEEREDEGVALLCGERAYSCGSVTRRTGSGKGRVEGTRGLCATVEDRCRLVVCIGQLASLKRALVEVGDPDRAEEVGELEATERASVDDADARDEGASFFVREPVRFQRKPDVKMVSPAPLTLSPLMRAAAGSSAS